MEHEQLTRDILEELYRNEYHKLLKFFKDRCWYERDARDLVQTLFVKIFQAAQKGNIRKEGIRGYLWSSAYNLWRDQLSRRSMEEQKTQKLEVLHGRLGEREYRAPEGESELVTILYASIEKIPDEKIKQVIQLRYIEGLQFVQIKKLLKLPYNTVLAFNAKGIRLLSAFLKAEDVSLRDLN